MHHVAKLTHLLVLAISVYAVFSIPLAHKKNVNVIHESSDVMESVSVDVVQRVAPGEEISSPLSGHHYRLECCP